MLFVAGVVGQTTNGSVLTTNQAPGLAVTLLPGELVGHEQVIRELIRGGTNEFMFVVPDGLRTEALPDGMIVLVSRDMRYYVSLRNAGPPPTNAGLKEALQERIASQYPHVSSLEEFTTTVADREGTGFQLRQELPKVGGRFIRILWLPFQGGVLEFTLNADSRSASAGQAALDMILLTFRSDERGKIEIVRRSENT
jgi:hypothetical protein